MKDLQTFFSFMNDVRFPYVVLRNWENLPHSVALGEHSDLDLLVYDIEHWREIFPDAKRVYPVPRVQFKVPIDNSFIQVDIRHCGDGYYPLRFEKLLIESRTWHPNGFYIPPPVLFRIALAYHAVHHKNKNTYPRYLGNASIETLLGALKESDVGWAEPKDHTVGKFNQYFKGATSVVEKGDGTVIKKQVGYGDYDLMKNEWRILSQCSSIHFPEVHDAGKDFIEIEDCGEELTVDNLPENWKEQLLEIIKELRAYKIQHRDIRPDNLMIKGGTIKLIDFGWARFEDDTPDSPPDCLGFPYRAPWGSDDSFAMRKVIREFEYKVEVKNGSENRCASGIR